MQRYIPLLALLAALLPLAAAAQDSARIVIISPRVGTNIDRAERDMYGLFRGSPDFHTATVFTRGGRYYGLVSLRAGDSMRDSLVEYREKALTQLAERIDNHDLLSAGMYTMGSHPAVLMFGEMVALTTLGIDKARLDALPPLMLVAPPASDLPAADAPVRPVSQPARVHLRNGSVIKGRILSFDSAAVKLDAEGLGVLSIPSVEVLSVNMSDEVAPAEPTPGTDTDEAVLPPPEGSPYQFADPCSFRGFILPTAFTVPRGEWFFADDMILVGTVGGGISNSVMLSGGTLLTFLDMFDESGPLFHFNVKAQLLGSSKAALSLGAAGLFAPGDESSVPLLPYLVVTTGTFDANLSLFAGMPTILGEDGDTEALLGFSGQTRVGPGVKLMFDAAYIPGVDVIPGLIGLRFFGKRMSGDVGFFFVIGEEDVYFGTGIPFANFTIFF